MNTADMDLFADIVAQAMETVQAPLIARIAVLEQRALVHGRDGRDGVNGKDAEAPDLDLIAQKAAALIPKPADGANGKDATLPDLDVIATKAAALIPRPTDGLNGKDAPVPDLDVIATKAAALIPIPPAVVTYPDVNLIAVKAAELVPAPTHGRDGKDGRDVDAAMLETIVAASVERVLAAWPKPVDGKSLSVDDVAPLIEAEVTKAVAALPKPKDGRGIQHAFIEQDGALAFTFTDGGQAKVGHVVGPTGKDADMALLSKQITDEIAQLPKPKDGKDGERGADGKDGLGIDDTDLVVDEHKGYVLRWANAERTKEQPIALPVDRGVYRPGVTYHQWAMVTAQGSLWIAQQETSERPGDGSKAWRLAVKRGRDGRDLRASDA